MKKIISLCLAIMLSLGALSLGTACSDDKDKNNTVTVENEIVNFNHITVDGAPVIAVDGEVAAKGKVSESVAVPAMTVDGNALWTYAYVIRPNGRLDRLGDGMTATSFVPEEKGEHVVVYFAQDSDGLTDVRRYIVAVDDTVAISPKTDIYLVKDCVTDYVIVVSQTATKYERHAANELKLYLDDATNADFQIVSDKNLTFDENSKYLSVGRTEVLNKSGVNVNYDELKSDGLLLKRSGNSLILCGGGDYGTLYAVYEFLYQELGWEAYAEDEIVYDRTPNLKLLDFDFTDKPAIEYRQGGYNWAQFDAEFAAKWRTFAGQGGMLFKQDAWYRFPHSLFAIAGPAQYAKDHADWFATGQKQPCFTSEGYKQQFLTNLKALIKQHISEGRNTMFYPVGLEDVPNSMCDCINCTKEIDKYQKSGLLVRWTNSVVEEIMKWKKEQGIEQEIYIPYLAYYETLIPPTVDDKPIDETVVLSEYSPLIFAPIEAANDRPYTHKMNELYLEMYKNWEKCSTRVMGYLYTGSFSRAFEWSDTIYTHTEDLKVLAESNAMYVLDDCGNSLYQAMAFQHMNGYVYSKLKWNPYKDTNSLIREYMQNYYKEAADYVSAYYYLMKMQCTQALDSVEENGGKWTFVHRSESDWLNQGVVEQGYQLLVKAKEVIENSDKYTDEQKAVYIERIEREMLTPLYYIMENYAVVYEKEDYLSRLAHMEELCDRLPVQGIKWSNNVAVPMTSVFNTWRNNANA